MSDYFKWNGQPIPNIHQWARDRGEKMVHYRCIKYQDHPTLEEVFEGEMPESFWNNLFRNSASYKELHRYDP